jgi:predicted RNase H-like HicB family nuclease
VPGGNATTATQPSAAAPASHVQDTPKPAGVTAGVLVVHGPAPFNHDDKQNDSYYATVRTEDGERTVWGLDLERAIGESGVQPGQRIELEKGGSKTVTAQQRQFDEKGTELAPKSVESRRNEWLVFSPDVPGLPTREQREALTSARREVDERRQINEARERFLSGDWKYSKEQQKTLDEARERIKAQAAREVLRDEIKGLPEQQQEKLMGEFESAVAEARTANWPLDVPMPQVSEATVEAVRQQIEREQRGQAPAAQQTTQQATPERGQEPQSQTAEHDGPTLEMEP